MHSSCPSTRNLQENKTALGIACQKGHVEVVRALIRAGADVAAKDNVSLSIR